MDPFQENQIELIEIRVIILSSEKETYFGLGRLDTLFLRHGCCRLITVFVEESRFVSRCQKKLERLTFLLPAILCFYKKITRA